MIQGQMDMHILKVKEYNKKRYQKLKRKQKELGNDQNSEILERDVKEIEESHAILSQQANE